VEDPTGKQYALRLIENLSQLKLYRLNCKARQQKTWLLTGICSYPFAALSIPSIIRGSRCPYNKVKLVYIPDDPLLGEYRNDFKNKLAYFEERLPESVKKERIAMM
jgi:hypothetical protein